ncbi:tetratricopeptide repeat protein [Candidatus Mesenet endosymbiont of Agriotes lineatus]|uniref:tetratricopeptide repeat protein n=1 Tax=Candidatus Mesenet endosymbiont of Agriotes lineatus TaxID=3077948 RepID=UPI0030CAFACD
MIKTLIFILILLQSFSIYADEEVFSQIAKAIKGGHSSVVNDSDFLEKRSDKFEIKVSENLTNISYFLKKAKIAFDMGSIEVAESFYKQILDKFPKNKSALIGLGNLYYVQKDYKRAHETYLILLKEYPHDTTVILNYFIVVSNYDPNFALKEMLNLSGNINFAPLYASIGLLYLRADEPNNAKDYMISALSLEPENVFYIYNLAIIFDKLSDFKNAAFFYQKLVNLRDRNIIENIPIKQISNRLKFINSYL